MALTFTSRHLASTFRLLGIRSMSAGGEWGSGAGKGGGSGGSVRESGGGFGKMEAAHEEQYFRKLQADQFKALKEHLDEEIHHHEDAIKMHQEAIERHKKKMESIGKKNEGDSTD